MMRNRTSGALFALLIALFATTAAAETAASESFASAREAARALYDAVRKDDASAVTKILGAGNEFVAAEDRDQDRREREQFVRKYDEMHRLVREGDVTVLYIGAENWPFPFPLVEENARWHFDAKTGMEEVQARRIGENELAAISTARALAAEKQDNVPPADAALLINVGGDDRVVTFHGYYFRRLPGGQEVLAYPAQYRVSGVMTFIAGKDGAVYEKDLGLDTRELAGDISKVEPVSSWHRVDD